MKIYTRTGDKGQTSLFGGKRVSKSDLRIEVLGEIDELNSAIGIAIAEISNVKYPISNVKLELINIQKDLVMIGAILSGSSTKRYPSASLRAGTLNAIRLEGIIDEFTKDLPKLKNFILPGGSKGGSLLHFIRSIARRAERKIVQLSEKEEIDKNILIYFNRLSDLLFTFARYINYKENKKEIIVG